jgi:hypothetical protein
MPSIRCPCGTAIDLSLIPNPQGFDPLWEPHKEGLFDQLMSAHQKAQSDAEFEKAVSKILNSPKRPHPYIVECPHCGRLGLFAHPSDSSVVNWYVVDAKGDSRGPSLRSLFAESTSK